MIKLYLALLQRLLGQELLRRPEMDLIMLDVEQDTAYNADGVDGSLAILYQLIVDTLVKVAPQRGRALDICCGSGLLLCRLAAAKPEVQFVGLDLSPQMLSLAEANRRAMGLSNVTFLPGDMYRLDETFDEKFDLITWHLALHHCSEEAGALKVLNHMAQLVKPDGTLFVFDIRRPKTPKLALHLAEMYNLDQGDWYFHDSLDSYKAAFTYPELASILRESEWRDYRHVEPVVGNMFQVACVSSTANPGTAPGTLQHLWQRIDYALLRLFFAGRLGQLADTRGAGRAAC